MATRRRELEGRTEVVTLQRAQALQREAARLRQEILDLDSEIDSLSKRLFVRRKSPSKRDDSP